MSDEELLILDCEKHGKGVAAVVCGHLTTYCDTPLGFVENSDEPNDLQGWCFACEYVYDQEEDLTDRFKSFNNMRLVCEKCYSIIKSKHTIET
ncbi:hypothetical protein HF888_10640 [Bermanella marisrubri]|uniref:Uncharacterized protein n=1 Tax=Bermanella marisrubri TaxID=207949 RepID=Q1N5Q5_9GAMM|nr:hypothetical protein [Bermanella marisrubri]EAT13887.1 hypothetical protein RED65_10854 [Oceanobacter sp. RED65] [Bermanella marisrubri]QIZ84646.1 hypothetical protein HF888_10640 [Bermanella marisrubri]